MTSDERPTLVSAVPPCPPYQGAATLAANLDICERTVDAWVKQGILPPPRVRGGKRLWKWSEVENYLENGHATDDFGERLKRAAEREANKKRGIEVYLDGPASQPGSRLGEVDRIG